MIQLLNNNEAVKDNCYIYKSTCPSNSIFSGEAFCSAADKKIPTTYFRGKIDHSNLHSWT